MFERVQSLFMIKSLFIKIYFVYKNLILCTFLRMTEMASDTSDIPLSLQFEENLVGDKLSHFFRTMFSKYTFFQLFNPNTTTVENPLV